MMATRKILPGAFGILSATIDIPDQEIKKEVDIIVVSNDKQNPTLTIQLEADAKRLWTLSPQRNIVFKNMLVGAKDIKRIWLNNIRKEPFNIISANIKNPDISVSFDNAQDRGYPIDIQYKPNNTTNGALDNLIIKTDHPLSSTLTIPIYTQADGLISYSPDRIYFGTIKDDKPITRKITIELSEKIGIKRLNVKNIVSKPPFVSLKNIDRQSEGSLILKVEYQPQIKRGYISGKIYIETNIEKNCESILPYSALQIEYGTGQSVNNGTDALYE